ncbi:MULTISPECIES: hypothetical protein [unclassified Brevundimonas]|uniref:hypothetical protein n=1 Tax=unclassified Brevundimonas TaxID=2622653 RepID=UPI0025C6F647|nr:MULTISPECIES: hypothetical protein [unclassified Brevundimonas]
MKKIAFAAASAAALLVAGTASAQQVQVDINGTVASKCGVNAQNTTVTLANDLTNSSAMARSEVTAEIASALNGARIVAFCNNVNSQVEVKRAVLRLVGTTNGNGVAGGFANQIRYNLDASLGGTFLDSTTTAGASTVAARFGGHSSLSDSNTHIRFAPSASNGNAVATMGGYSDQYHTNWGSNTDRRLAAGTYQGAVQVVLTPGA